MAFSNFLVIMDSASSAMFCPSYASVSGPFYSSSHPFGSSKITKSTCQHNAMRYLYKVGRAEVYCSGCREKKDPYPSLPTLKSLAISSFSHSENQKFRVYALKSPKGFGPPPAKRTKKKKRMLEDEEEEEDEDEEQEPEDAVIPEIVTNRMIKRMVASVGAPLAIGLTFFPLFYYMKVVLKWSVPDWLPFITSFFTFGSAALGITYGIMSTSWDPLREGSFLGWTEAQMNWPVFWQSVWKREKK